LHWKIVEKLQIIIINYLTDHCNVVSDETDGDREIRLIQRRIAHVRLPQYTRQ